MIPALALSFLIVPVLELYLIFTVSHYIGLLDTIAILLTLSILGAVLVKREGLRAWDRLRSTISAGRLPGREIADAALVLIGGALLLTPGFFTDVVGLLLLLPITRPVARRVVVAMATRRALRRGGRRAHGRPGAAQPRVIDVEPVRPPDRP
jgi:UPF0716 protein FxsA